jgi:pantetheine-phosphate adenylyltransferase
MTDASSHTAVYPGTFDPFTCGHLDIVHRASTVFDQIIILLAENTQKKTMFDMQARKAMMEEIFKDHPQVKVQTFDGLLIHYMQQAQHRVILRGLRTVSDFEYEFQMAQANKTMKTDIETFFMITQSQYSFISSTLIKEIARLGGNVEGMVPPVVQKALKEKYAG